MKIPDGWKKEKLGDVVNKINDKVPNRDEWTFDRFIGGEHFDEGEIRVTRSAPIEGNEEVIGSAFHMRFKPGQVLYVTRNPRLRKGGMVDFEGVCSNVSFVMETDSKQLLQSLLPFIIQTEDFVKHTCNNAHGSTNPFLNWKDIARYEVLLPPIEEQKKISEILWYLEQNLELVYKLLKSTLIFRKVFAKKIFSKKWQYIPLNRVCENLDSRRIPIEESKRIKGEIPYYGATGIVDYVNNFIFDEEILLIAEDCGEWGPNSDTSFIVRGKSWVNNHSHVLKCLKIEINFLKEYLNFKDLRKYVVGTTRGKLTKKSLMNIPVPSISQQEQKTIASYFVNINKYVEGVKKYIDNLKIFRNKLSNELLSGNWRLR